MYKYGVISGPYFPALGLNTEIYFVSLHIQSECGKIRTRNYFVFGSSRLQIFFKIAVLRNVAGNSVLFKTCSKKFDRDFSHERVKQIEDTLLILKMKPSYINF